MGSNIRFYRSMRSHRSLWAAAGLLSCLFISGGAWAQDVPAKQLFGKLRDAAKLPPRAIGEYARGCLSGGKALAVNGPSWQAMRLSRNRHWGHPKLVGYIQRLARDSVEKEGWPGLLIGDMSQPRGGPMLTGHRSHQLGLDADIWLIPMPDRRLSRKEREKMSARSVLAKNKISVNKTVWRPGHVRLLKRAASDPDVARIFVHPAIKKALCEAAGADRSWLRRIRPWWGHHYHFHVRLKCPAKGVACKNQKPPPAGDGCGKQLTDWLKLIDPTRPKPKVKKKKKKRKPLTLASLPPDCRLVLRAPSSSNKEALPAKKNGQKKTSSLPKKAPLPPPTRNPL